MSGVDVRVAMEPGRSLGLVVGVGLGVGVVVAISASFILNAKVQYPIPTTIKSNKFFRALNVIPLVIGTHQPPTTKFFMTASR